MKKKKETTKNVKLVTTYRYIWVLLHIYCDVISTGNMSKIILELYWNFKPARQYTPCWEKPRKEPQLFWSEPGFELWTLRIRGQYDEFRSALCSVHSETSSQTALQAGGNWNKNVHFQPLQRCYCENSGSPARACVMRCRYSITYTQSLHAINGLLAVGRVGNLLCGRLYNAAVFIFVSLKNFIDLRARKVICLFILISLNNCSKCTNKNWATSHLYIARNLCIVRCPAVTFFIKFRD